MPAVNAAAEEKPKQNATEKAAPAKEATKVETKAAEPAPKADAAAIQMEAEGMKKPPRKA